MEDEGGEEVLGRRDDREGPEDRVLEELVNGYKVLQRSETRIRDEKVVREEKKQTDEGRDAEE